MKRLVSFILGVALCTCGAGFTGATERSSDPVIIAIDAAIVSLKEQPNQFLLIVSSTGMSVTSTGSGTGMTVEVTGGGPGSHTTGLNVSANSGQVTIAQSTADQALKEQAEKAISLLTEIKTSLQAKKVDKSKITSHLTEFGKTYVAPVLKSVIEALVKKKLGL